MKFVLTLIGIVALFFGGMYVYTKYFKKEATALKPPTKQVAEDQAKTSTKAATATNDDMKLKTKTKKTDAKKEESTLITADTPIKHSRWGKKIDSIYKKHNTALEKAGSTDK